MRETRTFRWELHRGQKVWSVQDSGATRIAFEEDVDAASEYVSVEIGANFDGGDKLMFEHSGLGQIGVPS